MGRGLVWLEWAWKEEGRKGLGLWDGQGLTTEGLATLLKSLAGFWKHWEDLKGENPSGKPLIRTVLQKCCWGCYGLGRPFGEVRDTGGGDLQGGHRNSPQTTGESAWTKGVAVGPERNEQIQKIFTAKRQWPWANTCHKALWPEAQDQTFWAMRMAECLLWLI